MNRRSGTYTLFFWLAFALVLFLNLLVWLYLKQVESRFHSELETHLFDVEQVLNRLMTEFNDDVDLSTLLPDDNSSLTFFYYQQQLEEIRQKSSLQSILLLSPQGEILVSSPPSLSKQKTSSAVLHTEFKKALSGLTVVSEIREYAGEQFMSAYTPIKNIDGFLSAVLVIEAKADFFIVLSSLKNRLLLFSFINLTLIILTALFLFRMIQRSMRYQSELKDQEHLVELGTMAASVAHELRNPLGIIQGTNDVIKKKYNAQDDEIFNYIPDEIKRLNRLIDDFLTFSRSPNLNIETLDLEHLTEHLRLSLTEANREGLIISKLPLTTIQTDGQLLEQALLNVILNAFQASGNEQPVQLNLSSPGKNLLQFEIIDNGPGIPNEKQSQVFTPFFTTKEQGTGLGLAITKRIIQHLQGNISLQTFTGNGARFIIEVPSLKNNN